MNAPIVWLPGWAAGPGVWAATRAALPERDHRPLSFAAVRTAHEFVPAVLAALAAARRDTGVAPWLAGWSLGGMVALATAAARPDACAGLLLAGATLRFTGGDGGPGWPARTLVRMRTALIDAPETVVRAFATTVCAGELHLEPAPYLARTWEGPEGGRDHWPVPALLAGLDWLAATDLRATWRGALPPLAWVHGGHDAVCPPAVLAVARRETPPGAARHLARLADAGHALPLTHPAALAQAFRELASRAPTDG